MARLELFDYRSLPRSDGTLLVQGSYACPNQQCMRMSVASRVSTSYVNTPEQADDVLSLGADWAPTAVDGREFPDVPEHIAVMADEAYRTASINARRGAVLLARSVIEATASDKKVEAKDNLFAKIDALAAAGDIRESTREGAHEVRIHGRDMAHNEFLQAAEEEDVEDVLEVMTLVLEEVYQDPARSARLRTRRATRQAQAGTGD